MLTAVWPFLCTFWAQAKQLNGGGELFRQKYSKLRVRLVDGSGLATAVVLKSIPHDTKQVFLHAGPSKIASATAFALCERGVQVCLYFIQSCISFLHYPVPTYSFSLKMALHLFGGSGDHESKEGI